MHKTGSSLRTRKDVSTLDESESRHHIPSQRVLMPCEILQRGDNRSWLNQAQIHGFILGDFRLCKHGNWFFLPWHRGYLYYFESIIRKLSGDDGFALYRIGIGREISDYRLRFGTGRLLIRREQDQAGSGRSIVMGNTIAQGDIDEFVGPNVISKHTFLNNDF